MKIDHDVLRSNPGQPANGKDSFTVQQNLALIHLAGESSKETGVKILHETHRGKWSFAAHITHQYPGRAPEIRLTLKISYGCNVAESLPDEQAEAVATAVSYAGHLRACVGYQERPQVVDPGAPDSKTVREALFKRRDARIESKQTQEAATLTITPEYGAPPCQQLLPNTGQPVTRQRNINFGMKDLLKGRYGKEDISIITGRLLTDLPLYQQS